MFVCLFCLINHEALSSAEGRHAVLHIQAGDSPVVKQTSCKTNIRLWKQTQAGR